MMVLGDPTKEQYASFKRVVSTMPEPVQYQMVRFAITLASELYAEGIQQEYNDPATYGSVAENFLDSWDAIVADLQDRYSHRLMLTMLDLDLA